MPHVAAQSGICLSHGFSLLSLGPTLLVLLTSAGTVPNFCSDALIEPPIVGVVALEAIFAAAGRFSKAAGRFMTTPHMVFL